MKNPLIEGLIVPLLTSVHVVSVLIWIGGVVFVTTIVFPIIVRMDDSMEKVMLFQGVEHRFAKIAKVCVLIAGFTGGLIVYLKDILHTLFHKDGLYLTMMLFLWVVFLTVLTFEKKLFNIIFKGQAQHDTKKIFIRLTMFHWIVMTVSLIVVFIGVYQGHEGKF
ncbi:hypothetical protein [Candidatus Magnetomonas plexicatena]|uniref:hypothetical protein n=1 Tax=Candidatus Magnetomonas plexicatena TaxID=2552947 RepID=UPI001C7812DD|nr:hypothetical protein E2O03_013420 [Nitrospirales bacterium LBB_01]